jgi:hypothetical protein
MSPAAAITGSPVGAPPLELSTVNETAADVPTLPAPSSAVATALCPPLATVAVFQGRDHGALVSDAAGLPSTDHVTA